MTGRHRLGGAIFGISLLVDSFWFGRLQAVMERVSAAIVAGTWTEIEGISIKEFATIMQLVYPLPDRWSLLLLRASVAVTGVGAFLWATSWLTPKNREVF
jgi:hypothetical protein